MEQKRFRSLRENPGGCGKAWETSRLPLPFMAVGALFGIKFFRRHAENIVALDAHPVQYLGRGSSLRFARRWNARRFAGAHG